MSRPANPETHAAAVHAERLVHSTHPTSESPCAMRANGSGGGPDRLFFGAIGEIESENCRSDLQMAVPVASVGLPCIHAGEVAERLKAAVC